MTNQLDDPIREELYQYLSNVLNDKVKEIIVREKLEFHLAPTIRTVLAQLSYDCFIEEYNPSKQHYFDYQEALVQHFALQYHRAAQMFYQKYSPDNYIARKDS